VRLAEVLVLSLAPQSGDWRAGLFPEQERFLSDGSRRKAALCGRRAGKSEALSFDAFETMCRYPGKLSVYIALTKNNARETLLSKLQRHNQAFGWGLTFGERDGQLQVEHPNGARLWLAGCKDRGECEKFRGADQGFTKVWVDEAASYGSFLEYLCEDVLDAALMDQDGQLVLIGTPGPIPSGYFYEVTTGDNGRRAWPTHHWNMLANPYIKDVRRRWDERRERLDKVRFRREYIGEWVKDENSLVYPFDGLRNTYTELPEGPYSATIGIDCGFNDPMAWAPLLWRGRHPELYIPWSEQQDSLIPSMAAARTEAVRDRLTRAGHRVGRIVVDTGGIGKAYAEEWRTRYGIAVEPAEKQAKRAAIEAFRGDLLSGVIKVNAHENRELIDSWHRITWNEEHSDIADGSPDHLADAALYAHRASRPWYRPEQDERELTADDRARQFREKVVKEQRARLQPKSSWRAAR
jgi:hypothetical protein